MTPSLSQHSESSSSCSTSPPPAPPVPVQPPRESCWEESTSTWRRCAQRCGGISVWSRRHHWRVWQDHVYTMMALQKQVMQGSMFLLKHEAALWEAGMDPAEDETLQMMKEEMVEVRKQLRQLRQQMKEQERGSDLAGLGNAN